MVLYKFTYLLTLSLKYVTAAVLLAEKYFLDGIYTWLKQDSSSLRLSVCLSVYRLLCLKQRNEE